MTYIITYVYYHTQTYLSYWGEKKKTGTLLISAIGFEERKAVSRGHRGIFKLHTEIFSTCVLATALELTEVHCYKVGIFEGVFL